MQLIIISDLHIGSGKLDDFDSELEEQFVSFLSLIRANTDGTELIINGDFLEFVQAYPWDDKELRSQTSDGIDLCFTEEQSIEKLNSIFETHPGVFDALNDFLSFNSHNIITIIPGNHDVDFFWPSIRTLLSERITDNHRTADRLHFHLGRTYISSFAPSVLIEHGHQYDPANCFYINGVEYWSEKNPPILKDKYGKDRLLECTGTRFLNLYINSLDEKYPFIDNIKPFSKCIKLICKSITNKPLKVIVAAWDALKYLGATTIHNPNDILSTNIEENDISSENLMRFIDGMTTKDRNILIDKLAEKGLVLDRSINLYLEDTNNRENFFSVLADNADILENFSTSDKSLLSLEQENGTLAIAEHALLNETKILTEKAKKLLSESGMEFVIMGHTHESVDSTPKMINYINTGSWTRFLQQGNVGKISSFDILKDDDFTLFPFSLKYVHIEIKESILDSIQLKTFAEKMSNT